MDPIIMSKIDHLAFHSYGRDTGGAGAAIRRSAYPTRNFWMTEVTNIGDALAQLGQHAAAYLVWDAYDSVYNHAILAGRGVTPPNDIGNGPPLISYDSTSRTYTPRKGFYEHAQVMRFVETGSRRLAAIPSSSTLSVHAFRHPATSRVTIVGRNSGQASVVLHGTLKSLPAVSGFEFYQTTESANLHRGPDVAVTNGVFAVTISANSTFTLTTVVGR
jgi:O-glycosyl hydrolase